VHLCDSLAAILDDLVSVGFKVASLHLDMVALAFPLFRHHTNLVDDLAHVESVQVADVTHQLGAPLMAQTVEPLMQVVSKTSISSCNHGFLSGQSAHLLTRLIFSHQRVEQLLTLNGQEFLDGVFDLCFN